MYLWPGTVMHTYNPSCQKSEARVYSSRSAWATLQNPVSKNKNKSKPKETEITYLRGAQIAFEQVTKGSNAHKVFFKASVSVHLSTFRGRS